VVNKYGGCSLGPVMRNAHRYVWSTSANSNTLSTSCLPGYSTEGSSQQDVTC